MIVALFSSSTTCSKTSPGFAQVFLEGIAEIPAGAAVEDLPDGGFGGLDDTNISGELSKQGYTREEINSVFLLRVTIELHTSGGESLDFFDSIAFFVEAEGEDRVEIARLEAVPAGQFTIELPGADVELLSYVYAPDMIITVEAAGGAPDEDTTVVAQLEFGVDTERQVPTCD